MKEITESDALNRMEAFCSAAEHCRAEAVEKMQRWGLPYAVVGRIVEQLEKNNFINEERFCRAFINDKYRFDKWGKQKIGQALYLKKIEPFVFRPLLNEIDEQEYLDILRSLLASKRKSVRAESEYELNGKLMRFAMSRGFELKDIRQCIEVEEEPEVEAMDENVAF